MGVVVGFVPWIVYWVLVGNVNFRLAVTVSFLVALLGAVVGRVRGQRFHVLDIGSLAVFAALLIAAYAASDDFLERWLQPLSNAGLFLIVLVGVLIGRPFVREYAVASVDEATAKSDGFRVITTAMTWMWVVAFGVMLVSSLIPPIVDGDATIRDEDDTLSIVFYWVIPFVALGIAGVISAAFPPWFESRSAQVDRRSADEPDVVAQAPPPADASEGGLAIDAPADSRFDEPFPVAVRGAPAGARVEVSAGGHDLNGRLWRSQASLDVGGGRARGGRGRRPHRGDAVRRARRGARALRAARRAVGGDARGRRARRPRGARGDGAAHGRAPDRGRGRLVRAGRARRPAGPACPAPGRRARRRAAGRRLLRRLRGRVRVADRQRRLARLPRVRRARPGLDRRERGDRGHLRGPAGALRRGAGEPGRSRGGRSLADGRHGDLPRRRGSARSRVAGARAAASRAGAGEPE